MPLALITGANRGLGLEFSRQYLRDGWRVIGCCRDPGAADLLAGAGAEVMKLDVTKTADVTAASKRLVGRNLDLIVCNAGVAGSRASVPIP
jgi:NAD(P)-dependent dehydrogenase (short-subunit alcohol dehydrogenase family)